MEDEKRRLLEQMAADFDRRMHYAPESADMQMRTHIRLVAATFFALGLVVGLCIGGVLQ